MIIASNFSDTMITLLKSRLQQSDILKLEGKLMHIDDKTDCINSVAKVDLADVAASPCNKTA